MSNLDELTFQESVTADLCNFMYALWDFIPTHGEPGWVQYRIAEQMQHGPERQTIVGQRGVGKSYSAIAETLRFLKANPTGKVLVLSQSAAKSLAFVRQVRSFIDEVPFISEMKPRGGPISLGGQKDEANQFNIGTIDGNPKVCSVTAYGIGGQITGDHVDLIICDDVETKDNCLTVQRRERILAKLTELEAIINPGGRILFLGTPHTDESIYLSLAKKGYAIFKFPVFFVNPVGADPTIHASFIEMVLTGQREIGDISYPEYYTQEDLDRRKFGMGPTEWRRQFLLQTTVDDSMKRPLKLRDLLVIDTILPQQGPSYALWGDAERQRINELEVPSVSGDYFISPYKIAEDYYDFERRVMCVDPAGRGPDECAWCVGLGLNGFVFIPEIGGTSESMWESDTLDLIAACAWKWAVNTIKVEPNMAGGGGAIAVRQHVRQYWRDQIDSCQWPANQIPPIPAVEDSEWAATKKEQRIIRTCEPIMTQHRVIVSKGVALDLEFGHQLTHITEEKGSLKHDDRLEAFSMVLSEFITDLDRNPAQASKDKKRGEFIAELVKWSKQDAALANKITPDLEPHLWRR